MLRYVKEALELKTTRVGGSTTSVPGRRRNPRGQGDRLRDELVDAASALLAESGDMDQLSLRGVARRAGVSAPSVYRHFPDVEHLTVAVMERRFPELAAAIAEARRGVDDPRRALLAGCLAYCRFALDHPGHYRVMFDTRMTAPIQSETGRRLFEGLARNIEACFDPGEGDGKEDATELAGLLWTSLHGIVALRINQPNFPWPPLEKMVEKAVHRLITGTA